MEGCCPESAETCRLGSPNEKTVLSFLSKRCPNPGPTGSIWHAWSAVALCLVLRGPVTSCCDQVPPSCTRSPSAHQTRLKFGLGHSFWTLGAGLPMELLCRGAQLPYASGAFVHASGIAVSCKASRPRTLHAIINSIMCSAEATTHTRHVPATLSGHGRSCNAFEPTAGSKLPCGTRSKV